MPGQSQLESEETEIRFWAIIFPSRDILLFWKARQDWFEGRKMQFQIGFFWIRTKFFWCSSQVLPLTSLAHHQFDHANAPITKQKQDRK